MTPPTTNAHPPRLACQRTQAAMLSVALALSTTVPAGAAFAQEPDQEREGAAPPEATLPDTSTDPDYDPSGEETDLPFDVGTPRDGGDDDADDGAPVDAEPIQDLDIPAIPLDAPTTPAPGTIDGSDEPVAPAEPAPPTPQLAPAPDPATPPPAAANPQPDSDRRAADRRSHKKGGKTPARTRPVDRDGERPAVRVTFPAPPAVTPAPVAVTTEPVEAAPAADVSDPARPGSRTHTVELGESLWMIASDLLGPGATDAEIATRVDRIYQLNTERIGADPNVLIAGTVLTLR
jgi:hypothetical protein